MCVTIINVERLNCIIKYSLTLSDNRTCMHICTMNSYTCPTESFKTLVCFCESFPPTGGTIDQA